MTQATAQNTGFCPHCDCERRIVEDKPWLPSVCRECGRNV